MMHVNGGLVYNCIMTTYYIFEGSKPDAIEI